MKEKIIYISLTLALTLGLSGTLMNRDEQMQAKKLETSTTQNKVVALEPGTPGTPPPIIEGQKDWEVYQGEEIDVLTGVTAKDSSDKKVKVTASSYSTDKVGSQRVKLTAEDFGHNQTSKTITLNVKVPEKAEPEQQGLAPEIQQMIEESFVEASAVSEAPTAPAEETHAPAETEEVTQVAVSQASQPTWTASTMYVGGLEIPYQNAGQGSGQGVIDSNPNVIATWGGAAVQSGNDGANTHFIGHNPGIFNVLFALGGGSEIIVTDSSGTPTSYIVNQIIQADDYATRVDTGQSYADQIVGTGGGERITLQTCINDDVNLIVMASAN